MGDKCKLMWRKAPRVGDKCRRQVGDKCKLMRPKAPKVKDKCGRQGGDKSKLMRSTPRVGDKCGRQVWKTSVNSCGPRHPEWETSVGDKWKTSVNSCGPRHPEWDASPETEAKSFGPGMQPFERSKKPIQVNLFGEKLPTSGASTNMHADAALDMEELFGVYGGVILNK